MCTYFPLQAIVKYLSCVVIVSCNMAIITELVIFIVVRSLFFLCRRPNVFSNFKMNDEGGGDLVPTQDPLMSRIRKGSRIATYMVGNLEIMGEADQQLMPNGEKKRKQSKIASFMMVNDVKINADKNLNKDNPSSTSSNQASCGGSDAKSNKFSGLNLSPPLLFGNPNLSGFGSTLIQHK